ncbi:MAG: right-handed parallel beta-helix repeat-containing protein [Chitinophagaceae bacterium]
MKKLFFLALLLIASKSFAITYYVATNGNDANNGTSLASPFLTISKAISKVVAGDIIYVRGGVYNITAKINVNKSGTASNRISLMGYPGDSRPVISGSSMATSSSNRGLDVTGSYWYIKGLDVFKAGDNGMHISGSNNIIDQCNFYENRDTGCQLSNGAANNQIINCDSYFNRDSTSSTNKDGNADGFAAKLDVGTGNSFKGCRAWQNSDDGWDGLLNTGLGYAPATTYDSCWCFLNGYLKSGVASTGNGNGFKVGGNNEEHDATLTRCLSVYNRVKGFDQNNNNGNMILYNCTGYKNKPNFGMNNNDPNSGKVMIVKNCVSFGGGSSDVFRTVCVRTNNSWQSPVTTTTADFLTVDSIGLRSARKANGGLPDINFMHLANGSDLINAGVNIGLPFNGSAPDIGCFESNYPLPVLLTKFEVKLTLDKKIACNWITASEINTAHFNIQKSIDGINFSTAGKINSKGASEYLFIDELLNNNSVVYYRLEIVDKDGSTTYSEIRSIDLEIQKVTAVNIFPNPAKNKTNISFEILKQQDVEIKIYDNIGKCCLTISKENYKKGSYTKDVNISALVTGNYVVRIYLGNERIETGKLIKL